MVAPLVAAANLAAVVAPATLAAVVAPPMAAVPREVAAMPREGAEQAAGAMEVDKEEPVVMPREVVEEPEEMETMEGEATVVVAGAAVVWQSGRGSSNPQNMLLGLTTGNSDDPGIACLITGCLPSMST